MLQRQGRIGRLPRTRDDWDDEEDSGGYHPAWDVLAAVAGGCAPVLLRVALERCFPHWFEEPDKEEE